MSLRDEAIHYAVNRRMVAVHSTGQQGSACVRLGHIVSVTEKLIFVQGKNGEEIGCPLQAVTAIEPVGGGTTIPAPPNAVPEEPGGHINDGFDNTGDGK